MALLADVVSWICLFAGSVLALIGGLGLLRLPDVFARMHGAGMVDTLGLALILLGLMFQAGFTLITVKLILIMVFVVYTSPTTTHALARACLYGGLRPEVAGQTAEEDPDGEPPSTP
jgi:multicomponent Na+:H+ antiporter subunit G